MQIAQLQEQWLILVGVAIVDGVITPLTVYFGGHIDPATVPAKVTGNCKNWRSHHRTRNQQSPGILGMYGGSAGRFQRCSGEVPLAARFLFWEVPPAGMFIYVYQVG